MSGDHGQSNYDGVLQQMRRQRRARGLDVDEAVVELIEYKDRTIAALEAHIGALKATIDVYEKHIALYREQNGAPNS